MYASVLVVDLIHTDEQTHPFSMIPKHTVHVAQVDDPRKERLHPVDDACVIKRTPLAGIARGRELSDPYPFSWPGRMQRLEH